MKRNGFVLIEVIITITVFAIIITAVYSVFYLGMKTWERGREKNLQKIRTGFLKIERELKDSFFFSMIPFRGTDKEMVFPLSVSETGSDRLCIIKYTVVTDGKSGLKQITRKEEVFYGGPTDISEKDRVLMPLAKDIRFEYAYRLEDYSEGFVWRESWDGAVKRGFPSGVRISLKAADNEEVYNKVVFLSHRKIAIK